MSKTLEDPAQYVAAHERNDCEQPTEHGVIAGVTFSPNSGKAAI
jgi:hypothetical protein